MGEPSASDIRLLLSDIDGTLLQPDHRLTQATIDAVTRLQAHGISFSVASSRPPRAMRHVVETLGVSVPFVGFNGGTLVAPDGQVLVAHHIEVQAVRDCLALLDARDVDVWVFADDQWLLRGVDGAYVDHERHALGYEPVQVASFEPYLARIDKIVAASGDFTGLQSLEAEVRQLVTGRALAARSQPYYLDITALQASKGLALLALAEHLALKPAQCAAIGDGGNDVAMFREAGLSIAMGQASAQVRDAADRVTGSNVEEGVAQAIERYLLASR